MADTKALEELNREIVKLVDELSTMNAKQARLKELAAKRSEMEQQLLGTAVEPALGRPGGRRGSRQERSVGTSAPSAPSAPATAAKAG
jgi:hypothetical protein